MKISILFEDYPPLPVFELEISQEEGCFAKAHLKVEAGVALPPPQTEGRIYGEELYFKGYLGGLPTKIEGTFADIELIACPVDIKEKLERLQQEWRIHPYWDPLWNKEGEGKESLQDVHLSSVYCDRREGTLHRSGWFEGSHVLDLHSNFFQDSLTITKGPSPLRACTVQVHASWIQREEGVENLSSAVRLAFPQGHVNTYTREALVNKWPTAGQQVGRSGIWILKSQLEDATPPMASPYSPPVILGKHKGSLYPHRVKRHWFKPTLWVGWSYHQKRKETLSFTLTHKVGAFFPLEGEHKRIEFALKNINPEPKSYRWAPQAFYKEGTKIFYQNTTYRCQIPHTAGCVFEPEKWIFRKTFHTPLGNPARASFFLTERGYQAAEHAMERAKSLLAKSARAFFVTVEGPWDALKDVTTDTTLLIADSRLPGGKIRGKVIRCALIAKGDTGEQVGKVTIACAVGLGKVRTPQEEPPIAPAYFQESYATQELPLCQTASGLKYFRYDHHSPPQRYRQGRLLKGINLMNGPDVQDTAIRESQGKRPEELQRVLSSLPTRLRLYFKDLRTKEVLEHIIPVTLASPWTSPQQVGEEIEVSA